MWKKSFVIFTLCGGVASCAAADDGEVESSQQAISGKVIVSCNGSLPRGFADDVTSNGDVLGHHFAAQGFATVSTANPGAYASRGCLVVADLTTTWVTPLVEVDAEVANPPSSGDDDFYFDLQWGHDAVNAPEAWNAGVRGAGVQVAVLDTGFDLDHPDLAPNINLALSRDFTGEGLEYTLPGVGSHGTHTAGTIAAADNGFGVIGVAPDAELVLIKVLGDGGNGSFGDVIAGMYYATLVGADIISMSLGADYPRHIDRGPNPLTVAMSRAAIFARQNGSTVIAAAGNAGDDLDHTADLIHMPSAAPDVLSISATAPRGWATDAGSDLDFHANYTNYGRSGIDFAGPGGDWVYPGNEGCVVAGLARPCWVFDLVFSTGNNGWYWSAGTSMAAPHVAGVAALILSEGHVKNPAALERELRQRADDLGSPGQDPTYGAGRVASGY